MKNWYKSEFGWVIISVIIVLLLIAFSFIVRLPDWVFIPPFVYIAYFVIKGIIYAWIINPYNSWKNKRK